MKRCETILTEAQIQSFFLRSRLRPEEMYMLEHRHRIYTKLKSTKPFFLNHFDIKERLDKTST